MRKYIENRKKSPKYSTKECKYSRLKKYKHSKHLSTRIFPKLSENMHYEILKYMNSIDLLSIRGSKLGGYQLTSNEYLRPRIGNYIHNITSNILTNYMTISQKDRRIKLIFEQTGKSKLKFNAIQIGNKIAREFVELLRLNSTLREFILCTYYIYIIDIYIYIYT